MFTATRKNINNTKVNGKTITNHLEMGTQFEFLHANRWYMYNTEFFQENEMHKILWNFEMQTDPLIWARRHKQHKSQRKNHN